MQPNDYLLLINGRKVKTGHQASIWISQTSEIYMLIARPIPEVESNEEDVPKVLVGSLAQLMVYIRWAGSTTRPAFALRVVLSLIIALALCLATSLAPTTSKDVAIIYGIVLFVFGSLSLYVLLTGGLRCCVAWGRSGPRCSNLTFMGCMRWCAHGQYSGQVVPEPAQSPPRSSQSAVLEPSVSQTITNCTKSTTMMQRVTTQQTLTTQGLTQTTCTVTTDTTTTKAVIEVASLAATSDTFADGQYSPTAAATAVRALQSSWRRRDAKQQVLNMREQERVDALTLKFVTRLQAMNRRKTACRTLMSQLAAKRIQNRWRSHVRSLDKISQSLTPPHRPHRSHAPPRQLVRTRPSLSALHLVQKS